MKFIFKKAGMNIIDLLRSAGYSYRGMNNGDFGFIKRIGLNEYPHYHIYAKVENENIIINLHLDKKKPSYEGSAANGGEYDGELVEKEMERIKLLITNN